jgi:hypothetical protein
MEFVQLENQGEKDKISSLVLKFGVRGRNFWEWVLDSFSGICVGGNCWVSEL